MFVLFISDQFSCFTAFSSTVMFFCPPTCILPAPKKSFILSLELLQWSQNRRLMFLFDYIKITCVISKNYDSFDYFLKSLFSNVEGFFSL